MEIHEKARNTRAIYISVSFGNPSLAIPALVSLRKASAASANSPFPRFSLVDVLLGLALNFLIISEVVPAPRPYVLSSPRRCVPTRRGSLFHSLHSLKRSPRLCLPRLHHQQHFESVHPHLFRKNGAKVSALKVSCLSPFHLGPAGSSCIDHILT